MNLEKAQVWDNNLKKRVKIDLHRSSELMSKMRQRSRTKVAEG